MDDRAWESFQELVHHYERAAMLLSGIRDRFLEAYASKPRVTVLIALGKLCEADYQLYRIEYELENFFSAHGWQATTAPFMAQEKQLQDLHRSLKAALNAGLAQNKAEAERWRGQNLALYKEYRRLKDQTTQQGQKIEKLQQENDLLKQIAAHLKCKASQENGWQAGYQAGLNKAQATHNSEQERLWNDIYQLNAQIRTLQADKRGASARHQAELDAARRERGQKERENADLKLQIQKLLEERNRSVEGGAAREEAGRKEALAARQAAGKQAEAQPARPSLRPKPRVAQDGAGGLIAKFSLPKVPAPLTGSKAVMLKKLEEASHVEGIMDFLTAQKNLSAANYRNQLAKCGPKFGRLLEKTAAREEDEDFAEDVALEYFKIIRDVALSNMMTGIQRNYGKDPQFYGQFLELMNKWLTSCGIYTRMVLPGARPSDEDYEDMSFITKTVDDSARHGVMERVERLPYYMDYQEADGETGKLHYDGQAISLRFVEKQEQA